MYRTQSDLNDKSVYPSIIVPAFWFISWPQSVDILSGNGENMRMTVDSVLYIPSNHLISSPFSHKIIFYSEKP